MSERRHSNVHYIPPEADRRKVHGVVDGLIARTIQDTLGTRKAAEYLRRVEWPIERTLHLLVGRCRSEICSRCN